MDKNKLGRFGNLDEKQIFLDFLLKLTNNLIAVHAITKMRH
jgi:hypothetical protein